MLTRKFQLGFCGDWIEIYEQVPHPKDQGELFLSFRKRSGRKVLPLFCGITAGGAKIMAKNFKTLHYDPTELCLLVGRKLNNGSAQLVALSSRR